MDFIVTFDSNGGTGIARQMVTPGGLAMEPENPQRGDFPFVGWYSDNGTFEKAWDFQDNPVVEDMVLYADWMIAGHEITFASNGGASVDSQVVAAGELIAEPENPQRGDYAFAGWFSDDGTFEEIWDFQNNTVAEDMTLYANWAFIGHEITFASNGGSTVAPQTTPDGVIAAPPDPFRAGYEFTGWYIDDGGFQNAWDFINGRTGHDMTLFARWAVTPMGQAKVDIIASEAMQQAGLSSILNAESKNMQAMLAIKGVTPAQLLALNKCATGLVTAVAHLESIMQTKSGLFAK